MELIPKFVEYGLLGLMLAVVCGLYLKEKKRVDDNWAARLAESQEMGKVLEQHSIALQASTIAQENRNRATESMARAQEATATAIVQLSKEVTLMAQATERSAAAGESYRQDIDRRWSQFQDQIINRLRTEVLPARGGR